MAPFAIHSSRARKTNSGFTLIELAVVAVIIGLITAIGLPAYQRIQRNTRLGALINDYRVFASAFQQYSAVNAAWPAYGGASGDFPQGMEAYLRATNWQQPTVFGGRYNWDRDVTHNGRQIRAAIAIYGTTDRPLVMTSTEMQLFDARYDDGNLSSGYFQQGFGGAPLYVIEDDPAYSSSASTSTPTPPAAEASPSDLENFPSADEEAAKAAAAKAAQEAADKAAADKAAEEKAAAEKSAREAAEKAAAEKAAKDAADKAAAEKAAKEAADKAAAEKAAKDAAEKAAKEAAEKAAADKAAKEAAEKAARAAAINAPAAKANASYHSLLNRANQAKVNVPQSVPNAVGKFEDAAKALAATDPNDAGALDKNTKDYENAQKQAENALDSLEKSVAKAEAKK